MARRIKEMETEMNVEQTEVVVNPLAIYEPLATGDSATIAIEDGKIKFELFSANGRGKKSDNAPCAVTVEPIDFANLTEKAKGDLIVGLMKSVARTTHAKMNAGYQQLSKFMSDADGMLAALGIESTDEKRLAMAQGLAKRENVILAFEPVTAIHLTADAVLKAANE